MNRKDFIKTLVGGVAVTATSPLALLSKPEPKSIINPDWENAEYSIEFVGSHQLLLLRPHPPSSIARYKAQPDGTLKRVFPLLENPQPTNR